MLSRKVLSLTKPKGMNQIPRPIILHSFLDTYSLSLSSPGCNSMCTVLSFIVFGPFCCTPYIMDLPSSINTRQRGVRGADQTHVIGPPLQLFEARFGRSCFGQRGSVGCCLSTEDSSDLRGPFLRVLPPYGGLGLLPSV